MILSNRHGYARSIQRACLLYSTPPKAESSRQALLRATVEQSRSLWTVRSGWKGKEKALEMPWGGARGMMYSAAALARVEPYEDNSLPTEDGSSAARSSQSTSKSIPKNANIPTSENNPFNTLPSIDDLPRLFTSLSQHDPIQVFLSIDTIHPDRLPHLTPELFDTLYLSLIKVSPTALDRTTATSTLIKWMLHMQSAPPKASFEGYKPGSRFRGGRVIRWLKLCRLFNANSLLKKVFNEVLISELDDPESTAEERKVLGGKVTVFIQRLLQDRRHRLVIDLLAHRDYPTRPFKLPLHLLTPELIEHVMLAYLLSGEPYILDSVFDLYKTLDLQPSVSAYALLIQASLEMGHIDRAREIKREVTGLFGEDEAGKSNRLLQLAILRGQKTMGLDAELQSRVLGDLQALELQPVPPFLHTLIRERLEVMDIQGAKGLLDRFEMDFWRPTPRRGSHNGMRSELRIWATDQTYEMAFETLCRKPGLEEVWRWWVDYGRTSRPISDTMVKSLVYALRVTKRGHMAVKAVEAFVSGRQTEMAEGESGDEELDDTTEMDQLAGGDPNDPNLIWVIPRRATVGIHTLNNLLGTVLLSDGLSEVSRVTRLMSRLDISPNSTSLEIILSHVRSKTAARPFESAQLLVEMLERAKDIPCTVQHLDIIIYHAIQTVSPTSRTRFNNTHPLSNLSDPTAGLLPMDELGEVLAPYIERLRERGVTPTSKSLANRLQFEALSGGKSGDIPTAKLVWNEMIQRGYRPRRRHLFALMKGYIEVGALSEAQKVHHMASQLGIPISRSMNMLLLEGYLTGRYIDTAVRVYEDIKYASDPMERLDMPAVTSMIRGYYNTGNFNKAAEIALTDLPSLGLPYDLPAISAAANALLLSGEPMRALEVVLEHKRQLRLNWILRRLVLRIRSSLKKRDERGLSSVEEKAGILRIDGILGSEFERRGREGVTERRQSGFEGLTEKRRVMLGVEKVGSFGEEERERFMDDMGWFPEEGKNIVKAHVGVQGVQVVDDEGKSKVLEETGSSNIGTESIRQIDPPTPPARYPGEPPTDGAIVSHPEIPPHSRSVEASLPLQNHKPNEGVVTSFSTATSDNGAIRQERELPPHARTLDPPSSSKTIETGEAVTEPLSTAPSIDLAIKPKREPSPDSLTLDNAVSPQSTQSEKALPTPLSVAPSSPRAVRQKRDLPPHLLPPDSRNLESDEDIPPPIPVTTSSNEYDEPHASHEGSDERLGIAK